MTLHACDSWRYSYNFLEARLSTAESFLASKCSLGRLATMTQVGLRLDFLPKSYGACPSVATQKVLRRQPAITPDRTRISQEQHKEEEQTRCELQQSTVDCCRPSQPRKRGPIEQHQKSRAVGVVVLHPHSMREALGSIPRPSTFPQGYSWNGSDGRRSAGIRSYTI